MSLANGITFTRVRARELIEQYLGRTGCCGGNCGPAGDPSLVEIASSNGDGQASGLRAPDAAESDSLAGEFFSRAIAEQLSPADVFRVTITSFLDAYNFDIRRLMKCCIHHVLPSGHVIPFCAYNVLYRDGHVTLPLLRSVASSSPREPDVVHHEDHEGHEDYALTPSDNGTRDRPL